MQSVKIDVYVHRYVSTLAATEGGAILNTRLIPKDLKKAEEDIFESEA